MGKAWLLCLLPLKKFPVFKNVKIVYNLQVILYFNTYERIAVEIMNQNQLRNNLVYPKENVYFAFVLLFGILTYIFLAFSLIGIIIGAALILLSIFLHSLMIAGIRRNGVKLGESQFPELYHKAVSTAKDMGLTNIPDIYIVESEGILNAFATRFFRRNVVVLYSGIFELIERDAEKEVLFVLAHEFAHLRRKHVTISFLLLPAMWIPFLGDAFLRACEYTCDRYAAYYVNSLEASKNALTMLAIGKELYSKVNQEAYMEQIEKESGFFVWLNEKLSTHPHLPKRLYELTKFFAADSVPEIQEPKRKIWLGMIASIVIISGLSAAVWFGVKALEKLDFWAETAMEVEGATPLMKAASDNDIELMEKLLQEGADINEKDSEGSTALHWAVFDGQYEAAKFLLEKGADPNTVDVYGSTPLITAVFMEDAELVALLLEYGADTSYVDSDGYTAYDYAVEYKNEEIIELLK